ncbi:hypothetical protein GCM10022402_23080 [Salinactinospora qingdaonensis]|uniref:Uncharacterized protein n=2 Tax=Salinactinospora qingdaonensis TaxID=702744 RepID=A0ABP7FSI6_9ACTN
MRGVRRDRVSGIPPQVPESGPGSCRERSNRGGTAAYCGGMKRILLTALIVLVAFVAGGWLLGLLGGLFKWALIIGAIALGIAAFNKYLKPKR